MSDRTQRPSVDSLGILAGVLAFVTVFPLAATHPGVNGDIAFTRLSEKLEPTIFTVPADGKGCNFLEGATCPPRLWTGCGGKRTCFDAAASPWTQTCEGGKWFAFVGYGDPIRGSSTPPTEIYLLNTSPFKVTQCTTVGAGTPPGSASNPDWSPDAKALAYTVMAGGETSVWKVSIESGAQSKLIANAGEARWSSSGNRLAFVRKGQIWTKDLVPGLETQLTHPEVGDPTRYTQPDWSPDGMKIACTQTKPQKNGKTKSIWVMDADGSNLVQLTQNTSNNEQPVWSPDGKRIAFVSDRTIYLNVFSCKATANRPEADDIRLTNRDLRTEHEGFLRGNNYGQLSWQSLRP